MSNSDHDTSLTRTVAGPLLLPNPTSTTATEDPTLASHDSTVPSTEALVTVEAAENTCTAVEKPIDSALLNKLPAEIRLMIWKLCFTGSVYNFRGRSTDRDTLDTYDENAAALSVLRICRQIHNEARPLFAPNISISLEQWYLDTFLTHESNLIPNSEIRGISFAAPYGMSSTHIEHMDELVSKVPNLEGLRVQWPQMKIYSIQARQGIRSAEPPESRLTRRVLTDVLEECEMSWHKIPRLMDRLKKRNCKLEAIIEARVLWLGSGRLRDQDGGIIRFHLKDSVAVWDIPGWSIRCPLELTGRKWEWFSLNPGNIAFVKDSRPIEQRS